MPGSTSFYGFRYPLGPEPPTVAPDMQRLAGDVDTTLRNHFANKLGYAIASSSVAISTATAVDIPGASITFNTAAANARGLVIGTFDANVTATGNSFLGQVSVDGVDQASPVAIFRLSALPRATISQSWSVTFAAAGAHTVKLRGKLDAAAGTCTVQPTGTSILLLVLEA